MYLWKLRRRVHVSWLIACVALGVVGGVFISLYAANFHEVAWLFLGSLMAALSVMFRTVAMIPVAIAAGCTIGLWRGSIDRQDFLFFAAHQD